MMEQGQYWGVPISGITGMSSSSKPQMVVTVKVTHQADPASEDGWRTIGQQERKVYLSFSDAAMPYSNAKLEKLGFNGDYNAPGFSAPGVELRCSHEEYKDKLGEKWDVWGQMAVEQAPDDVIRQLNAKWRAKHPTKAAGRPTPPPPKREPAPVAATEPEGAESPSVDKSDIPF